MNHQAASGSCVAVAAMLALCSAACGASDPDPVPVEPGELGGWTPGTALPSSTEPLRGMLDVRGLIHAHTVYSHDACDGEPRDEQTGAINEPCLQDFRDGMCGARHDFVMLTDHDDTFARTEYPDALLHDPALGDVLVDRGGPVASWAQCADATQWLVMAGTESSTMPVGLEGHVGATEDERKMVYNAVTDVAVDTLQAQGAVVLLQHTEDWDVDVIESLGVDGFEMYNLHANTITGAGGVFELMAIATQRPEDLPHSDLILMPIINEDARYLDTWSTVLARGNRRVGTMGTDTHRNTFDTEMPDGDRIDSYLRMMKWLSNHLLVRPDANGNWNDVELKQALREGRLYGVIEMLGHPEGFDYHALEGSEIREMGDEASLAAGVELVVNGPRVRDLAPEAEQPIITLRLLQAQDGGWKLVDETTDDELRVTVSEEGAYRAEARMTPLHLRRYLGGFAELADSDVQWVYGNAIYVIP